MFNRSILLLGVAAWLLPSVAHAVPKDGIAWQRDLKAALGASKKSGRPVLIRFYADWCPPCRQMGRESWPDKKIAAMSQNFIPVLLDFDQAREARRRYEVRVVPYALVVSPTGKVLGRVKGNQPSFELWHALDQALADRDLEKAGMERPASSR